MAKFTVTTGNSTNTVKIEPGESLEIPLKWENFDGSSRDMTGVTVTASIYMPTDYARAAPIDVPQEDPFLLHVPANITRPFLPGTYHTEIWETRPAVNPADDAYESAGNFRLVVSR